MNVIGKRRIWVKRRLDDEPAASIETATVQDQAETRTEVADRDCTPLQWKPDGPTSAWTWAGPVEVEE